MTHINGYYYFDSENNEVFHVPMVFVVIEPTIDSTKVILEPRRLQSRFRGLKRVMANGLRGIEVVGVHENDIQKIISLCSSNKDDKAEAHCRKVYDRMIDELSAYHQEISEDYDPGIMEESF